MGGPAWVPAWPPGTTGTAARQDIARTTRTPVRPEKNVLRRATAEYSNMKFDYRFRFLGRQFYDWWRGAVVERRSLPGELSLSCARPAADG